MEAYLHLLREVIEQGERRKTRAVLKSTGQTVDALSVFGRQVRFDLSKGFPALTTKKLFFKGVVYELLWFLKGDTNVKFLQENNITIWDEWAGSDGKLGPVYGQQWRRWKDYRGGTIDQVQKLIEAIQKDPQSRRLIVSAWNVAEIEEMALPPCHILIQFYVSNNKLSCQLYQRSADIFLGVPFNIASYALLTHMIAQVTNLQPGEFIHTFGDLHLYENALPQAKEQLQKEPYPLPTLWLNPKIRNIDDFKFEDIKLENYRHHPSLQAEVAV